MMSDQRRRKGDRYNFDGEMKATTILIFRHCQMRYADTRIFQHQEAVFLMLCKHHNNFIFLLLLNMLSHSILIIRGYINDNVKFIAPEMTSHQVESHQSLFREKRLCFFPYKSFTSLSRPRITSLYPQYARS